MKETKILGLEKYFTSEFVSHTSKVEQLNRNQLQTIYEPKDSNKSIIINNTDLRKCLAINPIFFKLF